MTQEALLPQLEQMFLTKHRKCKLEVGEYMKILTFCHGMFVLIDWTGYKTNCIIVLHETNPHIRTDPQVATPQRRGEVRYTLGREYSYSRYGDNLKRPRPVTAPHLARPATAPHSTRQRLGPVHQQVQISSQTSTYHEKNTEQATGRIFPPQQPSLLSIPNQLPLFPIPQQLSLPSTSQEHNNERSGE